MCLGCEYERQNFYCWFLPFPTSLSPHAVCLVVTFFISSTPPPPFHIYMSKKEENKTKKQQPQNPVIYIYTDCAGGVYLAMHDRRQQTLSTWSGSCCFSSKTRMPPPPPPPTHTHTNSPHLFVWHPHHVGVAHPVVLLCVCVRCCCLFSVFLSSLPPSDVSYSVRPVTCGCT